MLTLRRADDRFHTKIDWLDSRHTFSFGDHHDPQHMGFRSLRVINDDRVEAGKGFGTHPHRDMEIVTYVLEGSLEHKDSMGNGSVIRPGDVQRMSAGTGILHSEFNPDKNERVHFLQIWIIPEQARLQPSYEQKTFSVEGRRKQFKLIASRDGREGSVRVHQDAELRSTILLPGERASHAIKEKRHVWLHVASGDVEVNGTAMHAGDGAAISEERELSVTSKSPAEVLVFDLA